MGRKILIVDDDAAIVDSMKMILEMEGHEVMTMTSTERINDVKKILPDLILLDIWMSGQDGRDVARNLKSQVKTKRIPIIMISASKDIAKSTKEAGADGFLAKPFEMDELLKIVEVHTK